MEKRTLKNILRLIVDIAVIACLIVAISNHVYNSVENLFIDKIYGPLNTNSLSRYTTRVNYAAAAICLIDIPYQIISLISKENKLPKVLYVAKYICSISLIFVALAVLLVFFPLALVYTKDINQTIYYTYYMDKIFTHIVIPVLFVLSFIVLEEKQEMKKRYIYISAVPFIVYCIEYTILVFIVKSWNDDYFAGEIVRVATIFSLIGLVAIFIASNPLIGLLLNKAKKNQPIND